MNKRLGLTFVYGMTIFLGSALLFNVQPMAGRILLPRFGGSAAVWTACLVAFQLLLLGGYAYAALLSRLRLPLQAAVHLLLLLAASAWPGFARLAITPAPDTLSPMIRVVLNVSLGVGPAYLLLASGSALLQAWLARACPAWNVYRLYAVSNAGSLLGLFAYPFLVEPFFSIPVQQTAWRLLFAGYACLIAGLAIALTRRQAANDAPSPPVRANTPPLLRPSWTLWILLPLLGSFLLTAATASLTQDITPMPLVWCLLLGGFLLSYVIGFTRAGEVRISLWGLLAVLFISGYALLRWQNWGSLPLLLVLGNGVVFFGNVFLTSWLYATRPPSDRLPLYYLAIAAGGAGGGLLAGILAPGLLHGVYEYSIVAMVVALLAAFFSLRSRGRLNAFDVGLTAASAAAILLLEPMIFGIQAAGSVLRTRNFYGVLRVNESKIVSKYGDPMGLMHTLVHGGTVHGFQAITPGMRGQATQYYGAFAGGYPILRQLREQPKKHLRVGVVGLGIGTLAAYGRAGDRYRFYEINPQVVETAQNANLFTYLSDTAATVDVALGDARLSLEQERIAGEAPWDVLIVDAFSGDAVPVHLLTKEAIALFLTRTAKTGTLAFHVSNRFIDLLPLLKAGAQADGAAFWAWHNATGKNPMESDSRWVMMTHQPVAFELAGNMVPIPESAIPAFPVLTDNRGSVLPLIDWRRNRMEFYLKNAREKMARRPF